MHFCQLSVQLGEPVNTRLMRTRSGTADQEWGWEQLSPKWFGRGLGNKKEKVPQQNILATECRKRRIFYKQITGEESPIT